MAGKTETIRGYCSQCSCYCRTVAYVRDGVFTEVKADKAHPLYSPMCVKGLAGPELVYNKQRLQYPVKRTRPKGDPDPGWQRITWDEALDTIAARLNEIKAKYGPEALGTTRAGPGGSALSEVWPWLKRFAHAYGTANNVSTTHICQWHRDNASSYTWGRPGTMHTGGRAEFEQAKTILLWGNSAKATRLSLMYLIEKGIANGAKLIVVDPRKIEPVSKAHLWLRVKPATDGALLLGMLNYMIDRKLYDAAFARDWTTSPFLVRSDTGNFLRPSDLTSGGSPEHYVMLDSSGKPMPYVPATNAASAPSLDGSATITLADGKKIECKTAFRLLRESVAPYTLHETESITEVPAEKIKAAVDMMTGNRPTSWYTWNGTEQCINATQFNRAFCILNALIGDFDRPGANVLPPPIPMNPITGMEFLPATSKERCLGFKERPLGPGGTSQETQGYEIFNSILTGKPYQIKALLGFGGNVVLSNAPTLKAREALLKVDFHVQSEMFMTPTAELADIVLPAASSWESWHVGTNIASNGAKGYIQLRPAAVPPQQEAWMDMKIIFELAKRMGMGDKFWNGDIEAAFDHMFAPSKVTMAQLKASPEGVAIDLKMVYQKYAQKDDTGKNRGFNTASKRVEIYSTIFKDKGYDPLPTFKTPAPVSDKYPLILTTGKVTEFCHSQHRALPSLRKRVPHPFLEINPAKAKQLGIKNGEWVVVETAYGRNTYQAKVTDMVTENVVCNQNGWWQPCPELNLPGYDAFSGDGANVNLLHVETEKDAISGSLPIKGCPCRVAKKG